jgi:hypothetical protein
VSNIAHWTGQELHSAWVDAPHSDKEREWRTMNIFDRARWEKFAIRLNDESRGAVEALVLARGTLKRVAEGCEEPAFGAAMCLKALDHLALGASSGS